MDPLTRNFPTGRCATGVSAGLFLSLVLILAGCDAGAARSAASDSGDSTSTDTEQTSASSITLTLEFSSPVPSSGVLKLWSKDSPETTCASFSVTAKDAADAVRGDLELDFSLASSSSGSTDLGTLASATVTTNKTTGIANNVYCPPALTLANQQRELTIKVASGIKSVVSDLIVVQKQPVYSLNFVRLTTQDSSAFAYPATRAPTATTATMDLLGAGDYDCAYAQFQLQRNGSAFGNLKGVFTLPRSYPTNVRLAVRASNGSFPSPQSPYTDYASFAVTPVTTGLYNLPVCAGTQRGTFTIEGSVVYKDELTGASRTLTVSVAPTITVAGGLVNYTDMSLTLNTTNARTLIGAFNNDASSGLLNFTLNLGSRVDGAPTAENRVNVYSETGRVIVASDGVPSSSGSVPFSLQILHMNSDRPHLVNDYVSAANAAIAEGGPGIEPVDAKANTECDAQQLAKSAAWTDSSAPGTTNVIRFRDIARNWYTTVVYAIRGQEAFNDALGTGVYQYASSNQGFVDRNQNGHYDGATTDAATQMSFGAEEIWVNGSKQPASTEFDPEGKWFIDMQRPYIDRNDDRVYTKGVDLALECDADNYDSSNKCNDVNPNGKRDAATTIWKAIRIPIFMGISAVSLTHNAIESAWYNSSSDVTNITTASSSVLAPTVQYLYDRYLAEGNSLANDFGAAGGSLSYGSAAPFLLTDSSSLGSSAFTSSVGTQRTSVFFFAQSICGTPLPGGSAINVTINQNGTAPTGSRTLTPKIHKQPGDGLFDAKRVFLKTGTGSTANGNATVNADVIDHPAAYHSFPVIVHLELAECKRKISTGCPTGETKLDCPAESKNIQIMVTPPSSESQVVTGTVGIPAVTGECG